MPVPIASSLRSRRTRRNALLVAGGVGGAVLLFQMRSLLGVGRRTTAPALDPATVELLQAAERANLCAASNAVGVGLRGEYFSEPLLRGTVVLTRVDDVVDFDAAIRRPMEAGSLQASSVRWTGWLKCPLSGAYRFHAQAPGMTVRVAQVEVASSHGGQPAQKVDLAVGRFYPIEVVVNEITDSSTRIRLEWTAPHGARYVVPRALLHLPTDTVASPRT